MKRLIAYAFALIITCTPTAFVQGQKARRAKPVANQQANLSAQQIAKRVLPAVGLLICGNGADAVLGSGFFISPGVLVTNYHVIEGNPRCEVRLTVGKTKQRYTLVRILGFDEESDLALLSVPDAAKPNVPIVHLLPANQWPVVGETVYALGNPEGLAGTISPGIVSAGLRDTKKQARLQITAPISHGSSGGPVVNAKGEVVGVTVGSLTEGQNLNFAVPSALLHTLLREGKVYGNPLAAFILYVEAESLIKEGKAAAALPILQDAFAIYRESRYYYSSADAHKSLGNNEKALAMLREGLQMFPKDKHLLIHLANMLAYMKRQLP